MMISSFAYTFSAWFAAALQDSSPYKTGAVIGRITLFVVIAVVIVRFWPWKARREDPRSAPEVASTAARGAPTSVGPPGMARPAESPPTTAPAVAMKPGKAQRREAPAAVKIVAAVVVAIASVLTVANALRADESADEADAKRNMAAGCVSSGAPTDYCECAADQAIEAGYDTEREMGELDRLAAEARRTGDVSKLPPVLGEAARNCANVIPQPSPAR